VNILGFIDRRERLISDKLLKFIPMGLFEIEGRGSSVGLANGSKWEGDVNGEVIRAQAWESAPFTCGG